MAKRTSHSPIDPQAGTTTHPDLRSIVRSVLTQHFLADDEISDIRVVSDVDYLGDRVYRITVVLEHGDDGVDGKLVSFVRHLRPKLPSDDFPIVTFISKGDAGKLKREAA